MSTRSGSLSEPRLSDCSEARLCRSQHVPCSQHGGGGRDHTSPASPRRGMQIHASQEEVRRARNSAVTFYFFSHSFSYRVVKFVQKGQDLFQRNVVESPCRFSALKRNTLCRYSRLGDLKNETLKKKNDVFLSTIIRSVFQ